MLKYFDVKTVLNLNVINRFRVRKKVKLVVRDAKES